jgi:hypothetical protein
MTTPTYKDVLEALLPPGSLWVPAVESEKNTDSGFDQLLRGMSDNWTVVMEFLSALRDIRNPLKTEWLDELELEFGIYPNQYIPESQRRAKVAAIKYARVSNGTRDRLEIAIHKAGFENLFVHNNSPAIDPATMLYAYNIQCGEPLAQCGEPLAQCGRFNGELIVNGDIFDFKVDYLCCCGETLMQCGEPTAQAGNYSGITRTKKNYVMPTNPDAWPFIFFVAGEVTANKNPVYYIDDEDPGTKYTVGDGKTYSTVTAAATAIGNLTGKGRCHIQVYPKAVGYHEIMNLTNPGSSEADYIDVEAMVSHEKRLGRGIVLDVSGSGKYLIRLGNYTRFHGFCITAPTISYAGNSYISYSGSSCRIYNNIFYDIANTDTSRYVTATRSAGAGTIIANNQIISRYSRICPIVIFGSGTEALPHIIANNSVYCPNSIESAIWSNVDYVYFYNNYAHSGMAPDVYCVNNSYGIFNYNISSDSMFGTFVGTGNLSNKSPSEQFVSLVDGDEDLNLLDNSVCVRGGENLSEYFTFDCGNIIRNEWDTGAIEKVGVYKFSDLPYVRRADLVKLILLMKPMHTWCVLLVNWT